MKVYMCNKRYTIYGDKIKVQGITLKINKFIDLFFILFLKCRKLYKNACLKLKVLLHSS